MTGANVTINDLTAATATQLATTTNFVVETAAGLTLSATPNVAAPALLSFPFAITGQTTATTVGAAGTVPALPSSPLGYLTTAINGVACKIPFYNT